MSKNTYIESTFYTEIGNLLKEARSKTYQAINDIMVKTYWHIGKRIVEQEQYGNHRAEYGKYLIPELSKYLSQEFGKGFSEANLKNMRKFYTVFPDFQQFATNCVANLSWTNTKYKTILPTEEEMANLISQQNTKLIA